MRFRLESDDRGDYFRVFFADREASFLIDPEDEDYIGRHDWRLLELRPTCRYVARWRGTERIILLHREIMRPGHDLVDHEDGDGLNDRRYNLRVVTRHQNDVRKVNDRRTASGYRGVYRRPNGRYTVIVKIDRKPTCLGTFDDPIEAARVRDAAMFAHHGEFVMLNFPRS